MFRESFIVQLQVISGPQVIPGTEHAEAQVVFAGIVLSDVRLKYSDEYSRDFRKNEVHAVRLYSVDETRFVPTIGHIVKAEAYVTQAIRDRSKQGIILLYVPLPASG